MVLDALSQPTRSRRRSELGLLFIGGIAIVFATFLLSVATTNRAPHDLLLFVGVLVCIALVIHFANRRLVPEADPVMMPVALFLNGIGYVMIERIDPAVDADRQVAWSVLGVALYVLVLVVVKRSRDLERYRYLMLLIAFGLLVMPLVPKIGQNIGGARLWVKVGPVQIQPIELAKVLLVIFFASYLIEKRELLTIPTRRIGNRLMPDLRAFGPLAVAVVVALLVILAEHDIGFSLILFVVFLSLLWLTTGRWTYLVLGILLFALGTFLASHLLSQVNGRIAVWLDPWKYYSSSSGGSGYQSVQGEIAFGRGGIFGTGIGLGTGASSIPVPDSDFIFAVLGEELGIVGLGALLVGYMILIGSGIRTSLRARSEFARLAAIGLTATLGFQTFFIMAGVTRLLPLTGVTLPFISYGGSSLIANYILLALLMRISQEGNTEPIFSSANPIRSSTAPAAVSGGTML